jgi:hypothetical protein
MENLPRHKFAKTFGYEFGEIIPIVRMYQPINYWERKVTMER